MSLPNSRSFRPPFILATAIASILAGTASAATVSLKASDPIGTNSFVNAGGWTDNLAPAAGNSYVTGAFQLRTPTDATAATFGGDSLSIDAGGSFLFKGAGIYTVNNLILNGGGLFQGDVGVAAPNNIGTIAGSITVTAASVIDTTTNANRVITVNSIVHGTAGLTIQGTTGTVNFTNIANDFTGPLTLSGTSPLVIPALTDGGVVGALGAATADAANLVLNGGTLRVNGATNSSTNRLFTLTTAGGAIDSGAATATANWVNTGAIVLSGTGNRTLTLTGTSTGTNTFAPIISDNGGATGLTKSGAGLWTVTAANTYTGATTITGGTLVFALPTSLGTGTVLNIGGGNLRWGVGNTLDVSTAKTLTFTGTAGLDTAGNAVTLAGVIGGTGGLTKQGANVLTITGVNSFSGNVSVGNSAGTIRITNSRSLGIGTKTITVTGNVGGTNTPSLLLAGGSGSIVLPGSFSFTTSNDGLNGNPTAPALVNESGTNTINGNFNLTSGGGGTRFLLNGGSLTLNGTIAPASGQTGRTVFFSGANNGSANGTLQDTTPTNLLTVTKDGAGTWVLNGANTYTGLTTVSAGTLITSNLAIGGGAVNVSAGSTFGTRVVNAGQTYTASTLTSGANSTLSLDLGTFGNPVVPVITAPTFNPAATTKVTFVGTNLSTGAAIPLIDYATLGSGGFAGLNLVLPPRATGSLVDNAVDSRVDLVLTAFDFPKWTGSVDANWNTTTQNWREVNGSNATAYLQGASGSDGVLFDDTATGSKNVSLTATLTPSSVTVNNSSNDYTFSGTGKLSGTTGLIKDGTKSLILVNTGGNDYTGVTQILGGALQIGDALTAGAGQLGTGPVLNQGTLIFNRPDDVTVSNVISGAGDVVKNGSNAVTLLAPGTFTGNTFVNGGTLRLGSANALGSTLGGTTVASGATLDVNGVLVPVGETITVSGSGVGGAGALVNNGAGGTTVGFKNVALAGNTTIGGTQRWDIRDVAGGLNGLGFGITKTGTNDVWFKDLTETGLGTIVISQGLLGFEGSTTMGSADGAVQIAAGATLGMFNNVAFNSKLVSLQGGRIFASGGTANAISGPVIVSATGVLEASNGVTLLMSGDLSGDGAITKAGTGAVEYNGTVANTYTGTTTVNAGTLRLNKTPGSAAIAGSLVANATVTVLSANQFAPTASVVINQGGTWTNASNFDQTLGAFTLNTTTLQTVNKLNVLGTFAINAGLHDISSGQSSLANTLSISGGANLRLGANSADSSFSVGAGGLTLNNGTLQLGQLGGAFSATVNLSGDLTASGTSAISAPNTLGPRVLDLQGAQRVFNILGGTTTIAPAIQNGAFDKTGVGNLVLTGTNTYTGITNVNGGTLVVNGSVTGSLIAVNAGGTLSGTGSAGVVQILQDGILSPGNGIGALSIGNLDFTDGAIANWELGGVTSDIVNLAGSFSLGGEAKLQLTLTSAPTEGFVYTLINSATGILGYEGGGRFVYSGNVLTEGETFTVNSGAFSQFFTINYAADGGNDVTLTAVPEPGSAFLLLGGLSILGFSRARRRQV